MVYKLATLTNLAIKLELREVLVVLEGKTFKPVEESSVEEELDDETPWPLGRGKDNDIKIEHDNLSREHCQLFHVGTLIDYSGSGTYIHLRTDE